MTIQVVQGDLFTCDAHALVCPVNTVGTMGAGLALAFKRKLPYCVEPYTRACEDGSFDLGKALPVKAPRKDQYVIHVATKRHWKYPSTTGYVTAALAALVTSATTLGLRSLAVPALGCGHGGLDWEEVRELSLRLLSGLTMPVFLFEPRA